MTKDTATAPLPMPGEGDVPFTLDGEELFLKPSLRACQAISRMHGNPHETANRIMGMDFDVITKVAAIGLNRAPNKALEEKIYKTGPVNIRPALIAFIHVVNNGGRPVPMASEDGEGAEEQPSEGNVEDLSL